MRAGGDCSESYRPNPLLLEGPELTSGTQGGHVKNLKPLWDKSPELLDGIGGEQLAESGFACEQPEGEFAMQESNEEGEE